MHRRGDRADGGAAGRAGATCSHSAIFSLAYLRVTENVRDAVRSGYFADTKWLNRVDTVFADLYFKTTSDWEAGRRANIPAAWKIALTAEDDRAVSGLGNFMLSMNAHINRDFPYVLAKVGLTAPDGTSHKADHDRYNQRLDSLYMPVFAEEARRFDPTFDDVNFGTVEETAAGVIMRGWREMVWRHAELLALARTPTQRAVAQKQIETYAALQALVDPAALPDPGLGAPRRLVRRTRPGRLSPAAARREVSPPVAGLNADDGWSSLGGGTGDALGHSKLS